jgi:GNAT superfamily N-acetyltransferase
MRAHSFMSELELSPSTAPIVSSTSVRLSNVRDYRDRFILRELQRKAIVDDPGFPFFDPSKQRAKLVWTGKGKEREAVGYCLYREEGMTKHPTALGMVRYPRTLSQLFVAPEHRRQGIATAIMIDFICGGACGQVYVESPKNETKALLAKLGYHETSRAYEMWEMLEGLSCWVREEPEEYLVEPSPKCVKQWVWAGVEEVGLGELL